MPLVPPLDSPMLMLVLEPPIVTSCNSYQSSDHGRAEWATAPPLTHREMAHSDAGSLLAAVRLGNLRIATTRNERGKKTPQETHAGVAA
jgi:hypothetical protein